MLVPFRTQPGTDGAPPSEILTFAFAPVEAKGASA